MTKKATAITYAAGIFTAFWLIIAFLITSVEAVTYCIRDRLDTRIL